MPPPDSRSLGALFADKMLARLKGQSLWGAVFPPRRPPRTPTIDARQHALEALADYVREIRFSFDTHAELEEGLEAGEEGRVKHFRLRRDRIFTEWPDDDATRLLMPCVEFLPGLATANYPGLTPSADERSADLFGEGTVLVPQYEHVETFELEVRATTRAQRHMLLAGIEQALQPSEDLGSLRLITGHYGQTARFLVMETQRVDDEDSVRRRRRATLSVQMGIDVVRLVRVSRILSVQVPVTVVPSSSPLP